MPVQSALLLVPRMLLLVIIVLVRNIYFAIQLPLQFISSFPFTDRSSLRRVFSILTQYSDWKSLGLLLGLESATLEAIKADNSGKKQACKREMLEHWLDGKDQVTECGGPTWQQLADCLKQLEEDSLAQDIEEQYCRN